MQTVLSLVLAGVLIGAPALLVGLTVRFAPRPLALAASVLAYVLGAFLANPNDPFGVDPASGELAFLGWRPRWQELLGAACKLCGLAGAAVSCVRIVRRWREPDPPPGEPAREWTCASCGAGVRAPLRRCPACGGEIWHPEDGAGD